MYAQVQNIHYLTGHWTGYLSNDVHDVTQNILTVNLQVNAAYK